MSKTTPEFDVAIVGAGIAGSALACALSNSQLRVVVIEGSNLSNKPPSCDGQLNGYDARVSALTLASRVFLEDIGVWESISSLRACAFSRMFVWDGEGTADIRFSASEIAQEQLGYVVENRVIVHGLLKQLHMSNNVKLLDGVSLKSIKRVIDPRHYRHTLVLASEDGEDTEVTAELVVGADGANSFVRRTMEFRTREWDYGHHGIVCTIQTEKPHDDTAWQRFMATGPIALLPLSKGSQDEHLCSIVWSADIEEANRLMALDEDAFCEELTRSTESVLGRVIGCSKRFSFPLRQRHAVDYVQEGIALVADAAHTIHPLAGQGINLGLQDVRVLSEELLRAKQLGHVIGDLRVLSRYQRRRKGDNLLMMGVMEAFKRLFAQQSLMARWIRNKGMTGFSRLEPLKKQIMKQAMGVK